MTWQACAELLELRHLLFDSIVHRIEAFYAYNPFPTLPMFGNKTFAVSDIPDLANKVILVTGGNVFSKKPGPTHIADTLPR